MLQESNRHTFLTRATILKLSPRHTNFLKKTLLVGVLWFGVALLISSITFLSQLQEDFPETLSVANIILFETICISPWAISTPFIVWVARRFSFEEHQRYQSVFVHLGTALIVFCFHMLGQSLTVSWFYGEPFALSYLWMDFRGFIDMRLMLYTALLLGIYAFDFQRKNREARLKEPRLKAQLNKEKYRALLNQIQPDFLIDSIESIERDILRNPKTAENTLIDLSDLLRIMLRNISREEVTVQEDLEAFHLYVEILRNRYEATIEKETRVDPDCREAHIPSFMMLIPFIEEIALKASENDTIIKGICYAAERNNDTLHLQLIVKGVDNNLDELLQLQEAWLNQLLQRLQNKYGISVELKPRQENNGISVLLKLPFIDLQTFHESQPVAIGSQTGAS